MVSGLLAFSDFVALIANVHFNSTMLMKPISQRLKNKSLIWLSAPLLNESTTINQQVGVMTHFCNKPHLQPMKKWGEVEKAHCLVLDSGQSMDYMGFKVSRAHSIILAITIQPADRLNYKLPYPLFYFRPRLAVGTNLSQ